ncbi:MAG: hypothetical protein LBT40_12300 [Deltaproteobacteria bacterium]|nr:hypothetical protein [Deltaproteobacteria bacterium]
MALCPATLGRELTPLALGFVPPEGEQTPVALSLSSPWAEAAPAGPWFCAPSEGELPTLALEPALIEREQAPVAHGPVATEG